MDTIQGIAASPGLAAGRAYLYHPMSITAEERLIKDPTEEWERLEVALDAARREIVEIKNRTVEEIGEEEAGIFDAHRMFLEDPALLAAAKARIQDSNLNAESAWQSAIQSYARKLEALDDEYLRARAEDVRDVGQRVLRRLMGVQEDDLSTLDGPSIIIARDLSPSDTARLNKSHVLAFCTARGGPTSHTAILARALGRPAVVGLGDAVMDIAPAETLLVDGDAGKVIRQADQATIDSFQSQLERAERRRKSELESAAQPASTADGERVEVVANVGNLDDVQAAVTHGAEGIGLLRTEFLFLERETAPSEAEQVEALTAMFNKIGEGPIVVRTLDVGGDKPLPYVDTPPEENPFLGWRAIRVSLDQTDMFITQLRALLRAGHGYDLRIMFPMVSTLREFRQAKQMLVEMQQELEAAGLPHAHDPQVGIMVEVPAAVIMADEFAAEADFFSIGSNDLTQYTFAAERGNPKVIDLSDAAHPAILRQVARVIEAGHHHNRWVGLCGELAGDEDAIPILLGLGLDEFSMSAPFIPRAKTVLARWTKADARRLAQEALALCSADEVRQLVGERSQNVG
jgi:phosphoenolpyruvate-protein phosphotransferase